MSNQAVDRDPGADEPEAAKLPLAKRASDYLECVERLKGTFPEEKDREVLAAAIQGCVEVLTLAEPTSTIDFPPPPAPPPSLGQQAGSGFVPRKKTKEIFTDAQRCWMAQRTYNHIYKLWEELGKPQTGPLYNDLIESYYEVDRWCGGIFAE
jgi:hypothetical protein